MKKRLNKKGFTLVELLAVIVVLAIILVITVPMVLNSISSTRQDALNASAKSLEKYISEQLSLGAIGKNEIFKGETETIGGTNYRDLKIVFNGQGELCDSTQQLATDSDGNLYCSGSATAYTIDKLVTNTKEKLGLNTTDYDLLTSTIM